MSGANCQIYAVSTCKFPNFPSIFRKQNMTLVASTSARRFKPSFRETRLEGEEAVTVAEAVALISRSRVADREVVAVDYTELSALNLFIYREYIVTKLTSVQKLNPNNLDSITTFNEKCSMYQKNKLL